MTEQMEAKELVPITVVELSEEDRARVEELMEDYRSLSLWIEDATKRVNDVKSTMWGIMERYRAKNVKTDYGIWTRNFSTSGGRLNVDEFKKQLALKGVGADLIAQCMEVATSESSTKENAPKFMWRVDKGESDA